MPKFSTISEQRLKTCHVDLQRLCNEVIKHFDFTVIEGSRSDFDQIKAFKAGKSKNDGVKVKSKHQVDKDNPFARAIDIAPLPLDWNDKEKFYYFAGFVMAIAKTLNIKVRWGGDWNSDNNFKDNKFNDLVHFEI